MNVLFGFCMFSGSSLLFRAESWVKIGPKIAPSESANYADRARHAIASLMRTRHSRFYFATQTRHPCGRVTRAVPCRAVASSMRPRRFSLVISSISCVPSIFATFLSNLQLIHAL